MTQDEIIDMALQTHLPYFYETGVPCNLSGLKAFAELVAAKEREACAKLCEKNAQKALSAQKVIDSDDLSDVFLRHHASAHFQSAEAIRARQ